MSYSLTAFIVDPVLVTNFGTSPKPSASLATNVFDFFGVAIAFGLSIYKSIKNNNKKKNPTHTHSLLLCIYPN